MKKAAETIIDCLKEKGMSQTQLAACMGEDIRILSQQLNRQNDFKVERFIDVLDHIGFRVEIVENDGIQKVAPEFARSIIDNNAPEGYFWYQVNDEYTGLCSANNSSFSATFDSKEKCFKWLRQMKSLSEDL